MSTKLMATLVVVLAAVSAPAAHAEPAAPPAVCPDLGPGYAHCQTRYAPGSSVGLGADDLASAYRLPTSQGEDTLVAISIAYDAPDLEADLNAYRAQYGLGACTTDSGCFRKVNQRGEPSPLPETNDNWALESTLDVSMVSAADVSMVSAACPSCRIVVVEGDSPSLTDLAETEDTAVRLGAEVVSNSYGARENGEAMKTRASYERTDATIVASSGDVGFTATSFPATLGGVIAVGGTTLTEDDTAARGWREQAWRYGSSGCSAYAAKPAWQKDTHCSMRTVADIAAAADNLTIHYDGAWLPVSGTSASAPFIAGLIGRTGIPVSPADLYAHPAAFFDVTTGANDPTSTGTKCGNDYLCTATEGYDAPTGLGTSNGTALRR